MIPRENSQDVRSHLILCSSSENAKAMPAMVTFNRALTFLAAWIPWWDDHGHSPEVDVVAPREIQVAQISAGAEPCPVDHYRHRWVVSGLPIGDPAD